MALMITREQHEYLLSCGIAPDLLRPDSGPVSPAAGNIARMPEVKPAAPAPAVAPRPLLPGPTVPDRPGSSVAGVAPFPRPQAGVLAQPMRPFKLEREWAYAACAVAAAVCVLWMVLL
jgi:hypothetical protein